MKKLITIALVALTTGAYAQKVDTAKAQKPVYDYFVKVPVRDYQQLIQIGNEFQKTIKYNPLINDKDSRALQVNLEKYLFDLPKSVKLDSVIIKK